MKMRGTAAGLRKYVAQAFTADAASLDPIGVCALSTRRKTERDP
jgi:hypothetical protein